MAGLYELCLNYAGMAWDWLAADVWRTGFFWLYLVGSLLAFFHAREKVFGLVQRTGFLLFWPIVVPIRVLLEIAGSICYEVTLWFEYDVLRPLKDAWRNFKMRRGWNYN